MIGRLQMWESKIGAWKLFQRWPLLWQLFKFAVIGVSSFLVDLGGYVVLTRFVGWYYLLANTVSFLLATVWSYFWNKQLTFRVAAQGTIKQYLKFLMVSAGGLCLATVLLYFCVDTLHWHDILAKFTVAIVVMVWNFTCNKLWTFRL